MLGVRTQPDNLNDKAPSIICLTKEGYYNPKSKGSAAPKRRRNMEGGRGKAEEEGSDDAGRCR